MDKVEKTGVNTFYAVDIGNKEYTVEEMYDVNTASKEIEVINCGGGEVSTKERDTILELVEEYNNASK